MLAQTTLLLYLANLVDEMIALLPHKARYDFSQVQLHALGKRYQTRCGLMNLLLGLIKLFKGQGILWEMVQALTQVFSMQELLVENYEEKLKEILGFCTYKCAVPFPSTGGNALPRTIYCKSSIEEEFSCEHVSQARLDIQSITGKMKSYFKCAAMTDKLYDLNKAGKSEGGQKETPKEDDQPQDSDSLEI